MKRAVAILLASLLIVTLMGCGSQSTSTTENSDPSNQEKAEDKATIQTESKQEVPKEAETKVASNTEDAKTDDATPAKEEEKSPVSSTLNQGEKVPEDAKARIAKLKEIVEAFIKQESYHFTYDEEIEAFIGEFDLTNSMKGCVVYIYLFDDMVSVRTSPIDWTVPKEARDKIAMLATMFNVDHFYSYLMMDYSDGFVFTRSSHLVEEVLPSTAEIDVLVHMSIFALEDCGDSILAIVEKDADVSEEYKKILEREDQE